MSMHLAALLAIAVATHYLGSFLQTLLHMGLGHSPSGGRLSRLHHLTHHATHRRVSRAWRLIDGHPSPVICQLVPVGVCTALAGWRMPWAYAATVPCAFLLSFAVQAFVHAQYHLDRTPLDRFGWFRRRRYLHGLHHEQPSRNFGVMDFFWDRLMGTFTDRSLVR